MKVVLKRDVKGLGKANDIKEVSEGYARNYLIPHDLVVPATDNVVRDAQRRKKDAEEKAVRERERAEKIAEQLKDKPLHFNVKAGETGRLYGSITSKDVADAVSKALGMPFDKRQLVMEQPLRDVGVHLIDLKLAGGVRAQVRVVVEAED